MKAVVQRVRKACVSVDGTITGKINNGLLVYLGVSVNDSEKDVLWLVDKVSNLRIFGDADGKMNLSIIDILAQGLEAGVLAISQFTLLGNCVKGRRPYYGEAADPKIAEPLYLFFIKKIRECNIACETGIFQAHMEVDSVNDGPVTILLDSSVAVEKPVIQKN